MSSGETDSTGLQVSIKQDSPIPLDAQFSCAPRELLALVGPSGSGKSTILRAIAGIFQPANCEISVDGEIWSSRQHNIRLPAYRRRAGMVFQSYALFPHMTILNNVAAAISDKHTRERKQFALELLAQVNLSGLEQRKPHELSGGQQQRVAVARALARVPEVLLLDEPFTAVDKITRRRLYREIIRLRRELEIPVVLVTHDLDEAAMLADTMVVLHKGQTLQTGTPEQITTRPATAELARLVDIRNVFGGTITGYNPQTDRTCLEWAGVELEVSGRVTLDSGNGSPASPTTRPTTRQASGRVTWAIPDGCVVVQRTNRPSHGVDVNLVGGTVEDVLVAGQSAQLVLKPHCKSRQFLHATVPLRIVRLNEIRPGSDIKVSLLPGDIHVMNP